MKRHYTITRVVTLAFSLGLAVLAGCGDEGELPDGVDMCARPDVECVMGLHINDRVYAGARGPDFSWDVVAPLGAHALERAPDVTVLVHTINLRICENVVRDDVTGAATGAGSVRGVARTSVVDGVALVYVRGDLSCLDGGLAHVRVLLKAPLLDDAQ